MTAAVVRTLLPTSQNDPSGLNRAEFLPPHISAARTDVMLLVRRIVRPSEIPSTAIM